MTRFVLLGRPQPPPPPTGNDRTSLVGYLRADHAGALLQILTEFATRGINLTRIESRPTKGRLGQYCFSIDCEGHLADARVADALAALHRVCAAGALPGLLPRRDGGRRAPVPTAAPTPTSPAPRVAGPLAARHRREPGRLQVQAGVGVDALGGTAWMSRSRSSR